MHRYLLERFLPGVVVLVPAALYLPLLGIPEENLAKPSAERPTRVPAGYSWLWHSIRERDRQLKK